MTDAAGEYDERRIGQLCARLSERPGPLTEPGPMRDLAMQIAAAVRDRRSSGEITDDLDALEDLLLRAGYTAGLSAHRSAVPGLPGLRGHPQLEVFACPAEVCVRVELPDDDAVPFCAVLDRPLRRVRLGS